MRENTQKKMKNIAYMGLLFPDNSLPKCYSHRDLYFQFNEIKKIFKNDINILLKKLFTMDGKKLKAFKGVKNEIEGLFKGTEPISLIASKKNNDIREFKIPNPLVQIALHWYILENCDFLTGIQKADEPNYSSNSKFFVEKDILWNYTYEDFDMEESDVIISLKFQASIWKKDEISAGNYYLLDVDVSNCFNNIYTHSASWLITDRDDKEKLNNLDVLIRNTNNNETKGIIIGPYTSSLFAEIIFSKFDKSFIEWINENNYDISMSRFVDDISVYADSKELLEETVIFKIQDELLKLNQSLNISKTKIQEFPYQDTTTLLEKDVDNLFDRLNKKFEYIKNLTQKKYDDYDLEILLYNSISLIISSVDFALSIGINECKYFLAALKSKFAQQTFKFPTELLENYSSMTKLLNYLINLMFKHNILSEKVGELIICLLENSSIDQKKLLEMWIKKRNTRKSHLKEIVDVWLGYIIILSDAKSELISQFYINISKYSLLGSMFMLEYMKKFNLIGVFKEDIKNYLENIKTQLEKKYGSNWIVGAWLSRYWIILYTNMRRWTIHNIPEFNDSILEKTQLKNVDTSSTSKPYLYIFELMNNLDIDFFTFENKVYCNTTIPNEDDNL